ncbi:sensor histidine kinase [Indioceanicola profundi]|uniref:sensor histidine kinase n=1 Tax=Indioceanicola profundi TaxID=2220096 RepID=UPI000E6A990A|nr:PAS domain S-box protein [Indioceanicola profundi]
MSAPVTYRIVLVGTREDLARVRTAVDSIPTHFDVEFFERPAEGMVPSADIVASSPDIIVIGASQQGPLPLARQMRTACPTSQIVFLLAPERLERFRLSLPFVPNLASAWTASMTADASSLGALLTEAAHAARERAATSIVLGRINQKLALAARGSTEQVRRSQWALSERYLATVLTQSPDAFIALGKDGAVIAHNDAAARLFGDGLEMAQASSVTALFPEEEHAKIREAVARAWSGEVQAHIDACVMAKDETCIYVELSLATVNDETGVAAGVSIIARDVTERQRTQDRLREAERRLNAVLDNASVSVFLMDERQHCIYMNAAAERLTGYSFAEMHGRPLHDVIHHTRPDGTHYPIEECPIDRAFPENNNMQGEDVFVHKNGHFYPVAFTASPVRDDASHTIGTIIEVQDITERKRAEARQKLLINELNHRVKNTLAVVQGLAHQSFRDGAPIAQARKSFEARLGALSVAHNLLTRQNWESALLGDTVAAAVNGTAGGNADRVTLLGPDILLAPQTAVSVGMAVHELCTNAIKYGALSNAKGQVSVRWEVQNNDSGRRLRLEWTESGGPPVEPPARRGFGSRMIERGLAAELSGEVRLNFRKEGVVCTIDAPLPQPLR